jgi:tetratricopeptide (TPR) repeat protein
MIRSTLSLLLLLWVFPVCAQTGETLSAAAGDAFFQQMQYPDAIREYESCLAQSPHDAGLLWRMARAYVCMAEVDENPATRTPVMRKAEGYARKSILEDARSWEGHTWLAAALGYLALDAGAQEQIGFSRELVAETDVALSLNPKNDAALSIRGSFYRALGNVGWLKRQMARLFVGEIPDGGFAEAEKSLREAIAIAPDIMRHHYELGVLYMDMDRMADACEALARAAQQPVRVAIDRPRLAKTRKFLSELHCNGEKAK